MQSWVRGLQEILAPRYVRVVFANVSSVLSAAVDDGLIVRNPCQAGSVRAPAIDPQKVVPWSVDQVTAVVGALPDRYRAVGVVGAGCGLRQGEILGLRVSDIDFLRRRVHVERQVKMISSRIVIAKPKGRKTRTVPMPDTVALALAEHLRRHPAEGDALVFTSREHKPLNRTYFNSHIWKPALRAAGVAPTREDGMHALRHFYASILIDAAESVKAVAEYWAMPIRDLPSGSTRTSSLPPKIGPAWPWTGPSTANRQRGRPTPYSEPG